VAARRSEALALIERMAFENKITENGERLIWLRTARGRPAEGSARAGRDLERHYPAAGGGGLIARKGERARRETLSRGRHIERP
jgi:hypothetical protein